MAVEAEVRELRGEIEKQKVVIAGYRTLVLREIRKIESQIGRLERLSQA